MKVHDVLDIAGGVLTIALVATMLTKANTARDVNAMGGQFVSALAVAEAGA